MTKKTDTEWYQYELAVTAFLQALDKIATVIHDVSIADKDTGLPRQRDVWIESIVSGFKIKIYVSCKYYTSPLNQQDMDGIIGELRSSGAHKGVVFSKAGFNDGALKKAEIHDIDCCVLVDTNDFAKIIPQELILKIFARRSRMQAKVSDTSLLGDRKGFIESKNLNDGQSMIRILADQFKNLVASSIDMQEDEVSTTFNVISSLNGKEMSVTLYDKWIYYIGELKGFLASGSYNFTTNSFNGSLTFPVIETNNPDLGPEWRKLEGRPANANLILLSFEPDYIKFWKTIAES